MKSRRFWKWVATSVAALWLGGVGLQAIDFVPIMWVVLTTLPGMLAGSMAPALWATDIDDDAS